MTHLLSKSRILAGLQCHKRLYLEVHHPELKEVSEDAAYLLALGHQVGEFARNRYPRGKLIAPENLTQALTETRSLMSSTGPPLFEATFRHKNVLVRTDLLHRGPKQRVLTEVKAASGVKDEYYPDCAVQAWVVEGAGYPLSLIELAHINSGFVYEEEGNYDGLLVAEDITEEVRSLKRQVSGWIREFKAVVKGREPDVAPGTQCKSPYVCPFLAHCLEQSGGPEYPVTELPNGGKLAQTLLNEGIEDIRDIPAGRLAKPLHLRMQKAIRRSNAVLEAEAGDYFKGLKYPRFYLDFETIQFAIPIWLGTRPYEQLPFQWSCHVEKRRSGKLHHHEFLDTSGAPPMQGFIASLLEVLGGKGPIFVYSTFERRILNEMAQRFPEHAEAIGMVTARLVDLLKIAKEHYYHPAMHGSWSIKKVLPTIAPELDYEALDGVHNGTEAQAAFIECIAEEVGEDEKKQLEASLLAYCKLDTLAMVRVARYFEQGRTD